MTGGGLLVLLSSWAFAGLSGWNYFLVLSLPLLAGLSRELYQFIAETNDIRVALQNVAEWFLGGAIFAAMIKLAILAS